MSSSFVFNQYYIDFLKRIKSRCKDCKETSETAKRLLKEIKENYATFDKSSDEYIKYVNEEIPNEKWEEFVENKDWITANGSIKLYKNFTVGEISDILEDNYLFLHFMCVFYIFRKELSDEQSAEIVRILQSPTGKDDIDNIDDDKIKAVILRLFDARNETIKEKAGLDMKFIEDTTIGKLAKDIMKDIDVDKLQKSIGDNGDVLKAIGDPDSGFAEIITSVSQKMASKISNGELKQENIVQDAMKFASIMPGLFGGEGNNNSSKKSDMPDMSDMMAMMSSMMGKGGKMNDLFKNARGGAKSRAGTRSYINESAIKKSALAKKMKRKLREQRKSDTKEDVQQEPKDTDSD